MPFDPAKNLKYWARKLAHEEELESRVRKKSSRRHTTEDKLMKGWTPDVKVLTEILGQLKYRVRKHRRDAQAWVDLRAALKFLGLGNIEKLTQMWQVNAKSLISVEPQVEEYEAHVSRCGVEAG